MKKIIFSILVFWVSSVHASTFKEMTALGREKKSFNWQFDINAVDYFLGYYNFNFSYKFNKHMNLHFGPSYIHYWIANPAITGYGITASWGIFFNKVYEGFYLEPGVGFQYLHQFRRGASEISPLIGGPQMLAAWAFILPRGFTINLGYGFRYLFGEGKDFQDTDQFSGFAHAFRFQFGYLF